MADLYGLARPLIRRLQPETAHNLAIWALERGLVGGAPYADPVLENTLWGRHFANPVGLAAGFDKDAVVPTQALALGFGFVEIGSVTPKPQPGNPKPRLFRLDEDQGVVNRMGFNSKGMAYAAARLAKLPPPPRNGIIGINLGKNKETEDAAADYVAGIEMLAPFADYVVVNVSSPNTPGLRALQDKGELSTLIERSHKALSKTVDNGTPPLLVKVAPDLTPEDVIDIADVVMAQPVDGLIATNTTIDRPDSLESHYKSETGGLSGRPLLQPSTKILGEFYRATGGKMPLIGVGGVMSGDDAYQKIRAGASLIQLYSGMVFGGPSLPGDICRSLATILKRDGFENIGDAVGADFR